MPQISESAVFCNFELRSKLLTFGFSQINLENRSLIRNFVPEYEIQGRL